MSHVKKHCNNKYIGKLFKALKDKQKIHYRKINIRNYSYQDILAFLNSRKFKI